MNMSANQDNVKKENLEHPQFRFKHLKQLVGEHDYTKHYNHHWKLQVAYFKNSETNELLFEDVHDEFFANDNDGRGEYKITKEEYKEDYKKR